MLLHSYRTGDANDPDTYVAAVAATLAHFPPEVITHVTNPVGGLPSKLKWLPSVKEVWDACEAAYEPIRNRLEREVRIREQLAARDAEDAARSHRPSYEELKAKHGPNWGITSEQEEAAASKPKFKAMEWGDAVAFYKTDPDRFRRLFQRETPEIQQATGDAA